MSTLHTPKKLKMVQCLLAGVILAVGILLAWAGYFHQWQRFEKKAQWVKTPCQITSWTVHISRGQFGGQAGPSIGYQYSFNGKSYHSLNYDTSSDRSVDLRAFEAEGDAARRGPAFCYVNPERPSESSFRAVKMWVPYALVGGGLSLALVGVIFLGLAFLPSQKNLGPLFTAGLVATGFLVAGFYCLWEVNIVDKVMGLVVDSQLVKVPARVEGTSLSEVQGSGKNRHRTYIKSHIVYSYESGGRRWYSDRWYFDLTQLDVGGVEESRKMLDKYPVGLEMSCWILPDQPWCATLQRGVRWGYLWLLLPLGLIGGGLRLVFLLLLRR